MIRIFIYETLKERGIQKQALGHEVGSMQKMTLPDYKEIWVERDGAKWPTIVWSPGDEVKGEIFMADKGMTKRLDAWEARYKREMVPLPDGRIAWAYKFKGRRPHADRK